MDFKRIALFLSFAVFPASTLLAQGSNPYVYPGSIGSLGSATQTSNSGENTARPFPTVQPEQWVGQRFIFLPADRDARLYAYSDFQPALDYKRYVGRIARVVSITGPSFYGANEPASVHLVLEDNSEQLATHCACPVSKVTLMGMGLVSDLDNARSRWVGKTLYLTAAAGTTLEQYDAASDMSHEVKIKKFSPVVVKDIVAGYSSFSPVRFILGTPDGIEGYMDVNVSNTNEGTTSYLFRFEDKFQTTDPHSQYNWPKKVWDAIEESSIYKGMTEDQVRMAWGIPSQTTPTSNGSEWIYSSGSILYFQNGVVSDIQH